LLVDIPTNGIKSLGSKGLGWKLGTCDKERLQEGVLVFVFLEGTEGFSVWATKFNDKRSWCLIEHQGSFLEGFDYRGFATRCRNVQGSWFLSCRGHRHGIKKVQGIGLSRNGLQRFIYIDKVRDIKFHQARGSSFI
ncbi:hypothetical protein Tco_1536558, partial [Tanacetum coccineum]